MIPEALTAAAIAKLAFDAAIQTGAAFLILRSHCFTSEKQGEKFLAAQVLGASDSR